MSWDDEAATWDDNEAVRAYAEAAFRSLEEELDRRGRGLSGARVLDFGCGTGLLTVAMAVKAEAVVGLDTSAAMVARLQEKGVDQVLAVCGGVDTLDGESFDLVTCSSVCAFLPDYPAAVAKLAGRLAPGGLFVQWDWAFDASAEEPFGLTPEAIGEALRGAGLREVRVGVGFERSFGEMVMAPLMGVGMRP